MEKVRFDFLGGKVYNNTYQKQYHIDAGWSSLEARRAHNPKAAGSNPAPATL